MDTLFPIVINAEYRLNYPAECVPLLDATLARIEANPETWDQSSWRCGTSACFAGHAALLAGAKWADNDRDSYDQTVITPVDLFYSSTGDALPVSQFAKEALGLSDIEANHLFHADNTLDDLRRYVAKIKNGYYR